MKIKYGEWWIVFERSMARGGGWCPCMDSRSNYRAEAISMYNSGRVPGTYQRERRSGMAKAMKVRLVPVGKATP